MSGIGDARLTVVLDLRHPLAFLGLQPAIAFGREMDVAIDWVPIATQLLNPPSEPAPDDDRGVRHKRHRAQMIGREIAIYAEAQGVVLKDPYRDGSADAANLGWLFVREQAPERLPDFLTDLFARYWSLSLDAADPEAVSKVVADAGLDAEKFLAWCESDGPAAAASAAESLSAIGVFQCPAYLVEDEVFYGRQHLPMVRWILEGRSGPIPI